MMRDAGLGFLLALLPLQALAENGASALSAPGLACIRVQSGSATTAPGIKIDSGSGATANNVTLTDCAGGGGVIVETAIAGGGSTIDRVTINRSTGSTSESDRPRHESRRERLGIPG